MFQVSAYSYSSIFTFMQAADRSAFAFALVTSVSRAKATPIRRPGRAVGFPNSSSWVSGSRRASSTPVKLTVSM